MRAVNLIPAEQRSGGSVGAGRSGGAAYVLLGCVAVLALMGLMYGLAHHQLASRTSEAASLQARATAAQERATQLAPYTTFAALKQQRMSAVETLVDSRFDWAHTMHEFGRVLPSGISLSSLTGAIGPAGASGSSSSTSTAAKSNGTVASATPPGSVPSFSIAGCATTQDVVATMLNRLRLIDGVASVQLLSSVRAANGSGTAVGVCNGAAFSAQVNFQALPAASAITAAGKVPASTSAASSTSTVSNPGVTVR
jgi:hypothetical protein